MIFKQGPQNPPPPIHLPEQVIAEVRYLIDTHKKIAAIKRIRQITGCGLKEAKDLADAMEHGYLPPAPQQFHAPVHPGQSLADRARAFRDSGDPDRATALIQAETGMTRDESARFLAALA